MHMTVCFSRTFYLFPFMLVSGFSVHLLTSPVTLEILPEANVLSLYLPVTLPSAQGKSPGRESGSGDQPGTGPM